MGGNDQELKDILAQIEILTNKKAKIVGLFDGNIELLTMKLKKLMNPEDQHTLYGATHIAFYRKNNKVNVDDWAELHKYVVKKNAFDILQKRISPAALQKRIDTGDVIPGVTIVKGEYSFIIQPIKGDKGNEES
jgi:phage host-nuclease inhibitor protein Gam